MGEVGYERGERKMTNNKVRILKTGEVGEILEVAGLEVAGYGENKGTITVELPDGALRFVNKISELEIIQGGEREAHRAVASDYAKTQNQIGNPCEVKPCYITICENGEKR